MQKLYKNHGSSVGWWGIEITENEELKVSHSRTLEGKVTTRIIPVTAKNIGRANETTALEQAEKEMASRIKKQLDRGYVSELSDAEAPPTNQLGFVKPMKAVVFGKAKMDWETDVYLQRKLDGHRCIYTDGILYSSGGKVIELPHITEELERIGLAEERLDGELYIHGVPLQQLGSLIKRPREESLALEYHVFDAVDLDKGFADRFLGLEFEESRIVKKVITVQVYNEETALKMERIAVSEGYEGVMLRWGSEGYQAGKRSRFIQKVKEYQEAEVTVLDWKLGQPYKTDTEELDVPVFLCENVFGGENFWVTAPGTFEEKAALMDNIEQWIGKTLTVRYFMLSDEKVPLQPTAKGWRNDI